jgi:alkaline phosphatase D
MLKKTLLFLLLPLLSIGQSQLRQNKHVQQAAAFDPALKPFYHGVASGDPLANQVIIWTRLTPDSASSGSSFNVAWYVATDTSMSNLVQQGFFTTDSARDFTVKVDVSGLQPGSTYYYMFSYAGQNSLRGKTKTLPLGIVNRLKFAVVSCNNYEAGFFNGFAQIALRNDIDAVLHLGDYIYEYRHGEVDDTVAGRAHQNFESLSKSQYRARYSLYRLDADLRAVHQQHAFINIWDDHESANDSWENGAQAHNPATEGPWAQRKTNASAVFFEWLPIRDNTQNSIYRQFQWGNLADLIMLDTRLEGRDQQINDVTNPNLYAPNRSILGNNQLNWFTSALSGSNSTWRVVGNQVVFAQLQLGWAGAAVGQTAQQVESQFLDIWDGYPAERQKVIGHLSQNNIDNTIFITGDFHSTFAFDVADTVVDEANLYAPVPNYNPTTGAGSVAVEFATPSITSANFDENRDLLTATIFQSQVNAPLPAAFGGNNPNPHLKYADLIQHGYFVLDITADSAKANYYYTPILTKSAQQSFGRALKVIDGTNHLVNAVESGPKATQDVPAPLNVLNAPIGLEQPSLVVFSLYPNPAKDKLYLQLGSLQPQKLTIRIYNLQGALVKTLPPESLQSGIYEYKVTVADLPTGSYFIVLQVDKVSKSVVFSKK